MCNFFCTLLMPATSLFASLASTISLPTPSRLHYIYNNTPTPISHTIKSNTFLLRRPCLFPATSTDQWQLTTALPSLKGLSPWLPSPGLLPRSNATTPGYPTLLLTIIHLFIQYKYIIVWKNTTRLLGAIWSSWTT